ncbi:GHKL domain-containing protein [Tissierella carlieri]|jgi:two-component system sensor histidine kinase AgrC|uniref:GHKL domain-containing protein n=1 Tax=Tissierella carlieri TaxID=689904 RepID=A0ABT1S953_9FIRM|nr:sensor histidine kinase [Tissierella carlieri]MBU5311516.1 GHKL domain-containing protein [Tissierella carlieri]MCQ4922998.1 GHKL domain-containing protein [Tissierella carlieri]MDU5081957.1 GHKL domain-containing protein [Bacillota bacterium]
MGLNIHDYVYLITSIFGTYTIYKFMEVFFDTSKTNKKVEFFSYIIYFVLISVIYLALNIPILNLISNILLYFALSFNYKASLKSRIISVLFIYMILISIESTIVLLSGFVYTHGLNRNPLYSSIIGMITIKVVSYMVALIMGGYKNIKKGTDIPSIYWISIFLIPLGSLYIILTLLQNFNLNIYIVTSCIIILFLINIIVFYLYDTLSKVFKDTIEKLALEEQNKYYQRQLEIIDNSYNNIKFVRHDMQNHLTALRGYIEKEEKEKAINYISEINDITCEKKELSSSGNINIDSILNYKLQEAQSKGILISLELKVPYKLNISSLDTVVILGNLLDNAIEASSKVKNDKKIDIKIKYKNSILFIYISNTFNGSIIYEGEKIRTTKEDKGNHGIGLVNIENILKKYNGTMKIYHTENKFNVDILMYID